MKPGNLHRERQGANSGKMGTILEDKMGKEDPPDLRSRSKMGRLFLLVKEGQG